MHCSPIRPASEALLDHGACACARAACIWPAGSCTQWEIYDEYIRDLERQRIEEQQKSKGGRAKAQDKQGSSNPQQQAAAAEEMARRKPYDVMHNPHLGQVGWRPVLCRSTAAVGAGKGHSWRCLCSGPVRLVQAHAPLAGSWCLAPDVFGLRQVQEKRGCLVR